MSLAAAALAATKTGGPLRIAGQTIDLELPDNIWHRHALAIASVGSKTGQTAVQLCAAAVQLCCPTIQRRQGAPVYRGQDVIEYGAEVMGWLMSHGATIDEVSVAGNAAFSLILDSLVTTSDLEEARGNSEAPEGH